MSRKEAIMEAATQLFAQRGFTATSTSAIAKEAGVAEGLIFHHYKTKDGILLRILEKMTEYYLSGSRSSVQNCRTGLDAVKAYIRFHFEFSIEHSDALAVLVRTLPFSIIQSGDESFEVLKQGINSVIGLWEKCIDQGKKDGTIRDIPTKETAHLLRGMLIGVSRSRVLGTIEVPDLGSHVVDFCVSAMGRRADE
ncbi:MAG: TetR/AcrR family transcriptional regulator [Desulfatiglans sp.]|jgi:AcrR family transcriptional regulator|nr:TetR/AcrR family transcriptional regulator [Thermodesulfobacteriota bacterium]MEE4354194.1 TetR/AcrR family transcriptional regulator [Desulfatiglans sp.]